MNNISVILPVYNSDDPILEVLNSILNQTLKPKEIIVIDSSINLNIQNIIKQFTSNIEIIYHWVPKAFPGRARNIGVYLSKYNYIAFIDSKTIADSSWLKKNIEKIDQYQSDYILGRTQYKSISKFQNLLKAATFGNKVYTTIPGSIFKKDFFLQKGGFVNYLRSGEDQYLITKIKVKSKQIKLEKNLIYTSLPDNFFEIAMKYFIYSYFTSLINIQGIIKNMYLLIFFIGISLLTIYDNNRYDILDINNNLIKGTFNYFVLPLMILNFLFILLIKIKLSRILSLALFAIVFLLYLYYIYKYFFILDLVEYFILDQLSLLIYFFILGLLFAISYRGIILPFRKNVKINYLFPINWLKIGFLSLTIDVIKAPGYIFGAINFPFISAYFYLRKIILK